ncbi:MAG: PEP-CTERM sorting domain-containing protein [Opitutaceae bacterium]|nr:PEP-CTERM sorting domain-containing protein [Opitutaceae bacterium]
MHTHTQTVFRRHSLPLLSVIAASLLSVLPRPAPASLVIDEGFSYVDKTAAEAAGWTVQTKSQQSPAFVDIGSDRVAGFYNVQLKKSIFPTDTAVAADSFTLTADLALSQFQGGMYVLVASAPDADGKVYGYAISWFAGTSGGTYSPNGVFYIGVVNGVKEADLSFGYSISANNVTLSTTSVRTNIIITDRSSGGNITASAPVAVSEFGSVTLTWQKSTGALNLYLGTDTTGTPALSITNTDYSSFASLYVSGNGYSYVNNLHLDVTTATPVPEPATAAALLGGLILVVAGIFLRRRC